MPDNSAGIREVRIPPAWGGDRWDTREALKNAAELARLRNFENLIIVDVDAHHYETESWLELVEYIDDPVIRHEAAGGASRLTVSAGGPQDVAGRVLRYRLRGFEAADMHGAERDAELVRRAMDAIGIDYQVIFPTPMLNLGLHQQVEVESEVARAYARWITERLLPENPRVKTLLYLPFNSPGECLRIVEDFGERTGVVGFMITGTRYNAVHANEYAPLFRAIEERGLPLGFHGSYDAGDRTINALNRFLSVHALGFPISLMLHMTNWIVNGMPERYPNLKLIWIEGGLAWVPFLMQRLDHEYTMRSSEAPLLERLPSDYMRDMYYTTQPMEKVNRGILQATIEAIGDAQLLYASDYPHWDFDLPHGIYDLPFLSEQAKRNILGENACRLFGLPTEPVKQPPATVAT